MVLVSSRYLSLYPEVKDPERRTYLAMVTHMDHVVGEVVKALKTTNQVHTRMYKRRFHLCNVLQIDQMSTYVVEG